MKITIDGKELEVTGQQTIWQEAKAAGIAIPAMCMAEGREHRAGCMVCVVKDKVSGRMMTSCSTKPMEGMQIETSTEEVLTQRRLALELLLSDHRADCEAPCTMVCREGLDVEQFMAAYDADRLAQARAILKRTWPDLPKVGCDECKAPCEKACRRGTIDKAVAIREIIHEVAAMEGLEDEVAEPSWARLDADVFAARLGRYNDKEKARVKAATTVKSGCLHCACDGREDCKLREYATMAAIKRPRYEVRSTLPVKDPQHVVGRMWFEPAKCIRCGLCVYNSDNGFTFVGRGFSMKIAIPEQNKANVKEELASICPTGAIYLKRY